MWYSVRTELIAMAQSIPLMVHHAGRPYGPLLFASDAKGSDEHDNGSYGIAVTNLLKGETHLIQTLGEAPSYSIARVNGDLSGLCQRVAPLNPTIPRSRLPASFTTASRWRPCLFGYWDFADHITLGEARTVVKLMRLIVSFGSLHQHIHPSLQDNFPVACVWAKGRSSSWALNRVARQASGLGLAAGIRMVLPWVESERQPADGISRGKW